MVMLVDMLLDRLNGLSWIEFFTFAVNAFVFIFSKNIYKKQNPIYLILDNITDMRNIGAIIRSASATGVTNIILPKNESGRINADTVKTSSGAIFSVSISKVDHIKDAIFLLKSNDIKIICFSEKAKKTIYETK